MKNGKDVHVVPNGQKWNVLGAGNNKAYKTTNTQKTAIPIGKEIAQKNHSELIIHGLDGQIRDKRSFGNDPFPPKG